MFYGLKFGEKPPNSSIKPMQPRGTDSRAHIYSEHAANPQAESMNAAHDWAKEQTIPVPSERMRTSALLLQRQQKRELAEKPQSAPAPSAPVTETLRPTRTTDAPFAVGGDFSAGMGTVQRASQAYGGFAVAKGKESSQRPTSSAALAEPSSQRIHDFVPAHETLKPQPSQKVVGTFPNALKPTTLDEDDDTIEHAKNSSKHVDVLSPDVLKELVLHSIEARPPTAAGPAAAAATPRANITSVRPPTAAAYQLPNAQALRAAMDNAAGKITEKPQAIVPGRVASTAVVATNDPKKLEEEDERFAFASKPRVGIANTLPSAKPQAVPQNAAAKLVDEEEKDERFAFASKPRVGIANTLPSAKLQEPPQNAASAAKKFDEEEKFAFASKPRVGNANTLPSAKPQAVPQNAAAKLVDEEEKFAFASKPRVGIANTLPSDKLQEPPQNTASAVKKLEEEKFAFESKPRVGNTNILSSAKAQEPPMALPRSMLSTTALQAMGNWRYQHTPQAGPAPRKPELAEITSRPGSSNVSTGPTESVLPADAPGPQIDWWVKTQNKFQGDRKEEGQVELQRYREQLRAAEEEERKKKQSLLGSNAKPVPLLKPKPHVTASSTTTAALAQPSLAPGTQLVVQPDGSLKVIPPPSVAAPPTTNIITNQATLAPKPMDTTTAVQVDLPPPQEPPRPAGIIPLASHSNAFHDSAVVQSVGGPPPTSIAKRTLNVIRSEREAQLRARWLLEAPARAEALQRKVDAILKSLRASVEAKGFSEPTKGAQYIVKICRQQSSTPTEDMPFSVFRNVLQKGFNLSVLSEEEVAALFDRLDVDEMTVVTFRNFGEIVFDLFHSTNVTEARRNQMMKPTVRKLLDDIKTKVAQRHGGESWMLAFTSAFRTLCKLGMDKGDAVGTSEEAVPLNAVQVQAALTRLGVTVTLHDAKDLIAAIDVNKSGTVDAEEFLHAMRGPVSRSRRELIFQAFNILDVDKTGTVTVQEMLYRYNAKEHPRVLSGQATVDQIMTEFMTLWNKDGDAEVSWHEFLDYYKSLSASIENDEYFELMMRNCWHMSGGEGAAQNTTCRRVLVTFFDKSQKVIEIKNDLGIGPRDMDKIRTQLEIQGVKNIEKVDLYG